MQHIRVNDVSMPALGLGTYQLEGNVALRIVKHALNVGYRHLDTAQMYGNEAEIGQAIQESGVPRDQLFIATKVWPDRFKREQLIASVDESLAKLKLDGIDLVLLHWPSPDVRLTETLDALMTVKDAGKVRHIGVSNFTTDLMDKAVGYCGKGVLVNNQVEYHPYLLQDKVIQKARSLHMTVTAYRPIAKGRVFKDDTITQIADAHNKTAAQVTLRWIIQQDIAAIPRSGNENHVTENFDIFDFSLSDDEMQAISALRGNERLVSPSGIAPDWDEPDPAIAV
ncbi:MAG: aldo/keto reductase [Elainellaceae cyanobacterium]